MDDQNPFKQIEPGASCPIHLKTELVAEIDLIRNSLSVVEVYAYDIFSVFTMFLGGLEAEETPMS